MIAALTSKFQSKMLVIYRLVSFVVLISIIVGIFGYIGLLIFYFQNENWGAPLIISPTQERVLSYQPQVTQLKGQLSKQRAELADLTNQLRVKKQGLQDLDALLARTESAQKVAIANLTRVSSSLNKLATEKSADIADTERAHQQLKAMMATTDAELNAGLISKEDAASRKITLQTSANSLTDSKIAGVQVRVNASQSGAIASTLKGAAVDLETMTTLGQTQQMVFSRMRLETELSAAEANIGVLQSSIKDTERVLEVAMQSPYFKALTQRVSVAFVPYENNDRAKVGEPVFSCVLQVLFCAEVGHVTATYVAEEYAKHPLFRYDMKGRLVEVKFNEDEASTTRVVFFGRKPLIL